MKQSKQNWNLAKDYLHSEGNDKTIADVYFANELRAGTILPVDRSKIVSRCALPDIPEYYRDKPFTCRDCGITEVWTAKQQKWWYEEAGGEIETTAIRCRSCRSVEKRRREEARQVHEQGLRKKNLDSNDPSNEGPITGPS